MRIEAKHLSIILLTLFMSIFLSACFHEDDEHAHKASIIPAVNPGFDSITTVAKSDTAGGTYTDLVAADFTYDATTETITLNGSIDANGNFFRIVGQATAHHTAETFTVYTYVKDSSTAVSANELTTYAVAAIAAGNKNHDQEIITTFDMAVTHLTHQTGLTVMDITMAMTAEDRESLPNLEASMAALIETVEGDATAVNLTTLATVTPPNMDQIAWGALLYDNWMAAPKAAPTAGSGAAAVDHSNHKATARAEEGHDTHGGASYGEDKQPANLIVKLTTATPAVHLLDEDGNEQEGFRRFARCKECHGWDQLGEDGSFALRSRGSKTLTNAEANSTDTGDFRRRPKAIANTNLANNTAAFTMMDIVPATGSGNKYGNIDTAITASTAALAADAWNTKTDAEDGNGKRFSDMHPDFTRTAAADATDTTNAFEGVANDLVPTHDQIMALVAYLNYADGKSEHVITWNDSTATSNADSYTIDSEAEASEGQHLYASVCFRCHEAPNTEMANPLHHEYENMIGFISTKDVSDNVTGIDQQHFSALAHVARWGKSGQVMTRDRIAYPTGHQVRNLMAYLKAFNSEVMLNGGVTAAYSLDTAMGVKGMGVAATGRTYYESNCAGCHQAHDGDAATDHAADGEDLTFRCHAHDTDTVVLAVSDACPTGSEAIPNLAPHMMDGHMMIKHYAMQNDLSQINTNMTVKPTQQNMNDLAAFFNDVGAKAAAH